LLLPGDIGKVCSVSIGRFRPGPSRAMSIRSTFVTVNQAAEILGVAPNTIRAWGAARKIPEYRHPLNGYRLYKRADLADVIQQLERSVSPVAVGRRRSRH
jgi:DNA (cytosine-5)-methyltransferase 1